MQRPMLLAAILSGILVFALYARISAQRASEAGPSGGSGVIEGTSYDLGSRIGGRIHSVAVREGQEVHAGDVVVELDCAEPQAHLDEADARIAVAEAQVEAARAQVEAARGQVEVARRSGGAARALTGAADAQAAVLSTHEATAQRELERVGSLGEYAPAQRRDTAQDTVDSLRHQQEAADAQRRASRAQASVSAAQATVSSAQAQAATSAVAAAERTLAAIRAVRAIAQLSVDECHVVAAHDGTVDEVLYEAGEVVAPGASLVRVIDLTELTATFYLPNAELSAVTIGGTAHVLADAWPNRTFDGTVDTVANEAEFTPRTVQTRTDRDRLVYPIEIRIPNPERLLRPGMPVQVTLVSQ
jgi:HlyD family secretion protein